MLLNAYIYQGTSEAKIQLSLKNNGKVPWPEKATKLIYANDSIISGDEVNLKPQKPNETENYEVIFKNLQIFGVGELRGFLLFNVKGKNYGEKITMKVIIKRKERKIELNDNIEKLKEFRDSFGLLEDDYSDEKILEALKKHNFDFGKAFEYIVE